MFSIVKRNFAPLIVGGSPADIADFPYQVSIRHWGNHICGGSIINPTTIVTAAHCIILPVLALSVRAGSSNRLTGGQVISEVIGTPHPLYNSVTRENDIAILKLITPLQLGPDVQPIRIPSQGSVEGLAEGTLLTASGWGYTSDGSKVLSEQLLQVILPAVSQETCQDVHGKTVIKDSMFCAGKYYLIWLK